MTLSQQSGSLCRTNARIRTFMPFANAIKRGNAKGKLGVYAGCEKIHVRMSDGCVEIWSELTVCLT